MSNTCLGCLKRTICGRICVDCGGDAILEKGRNMLEFHFGDDPGFPHDVNYDIWVTDYENEGYEGSGEAVGINLNKKEVNEYNLSHCSCNDPLECPNDTYSLDKFMNNAICAVSDKVYKKSLELLEEYNNV